MLLIPKENTEQQKHSESADLPPAAHFQYILYIYIVISIQCSSPTFMQNESKFMLCEHMNHYTRVTAAIAVLPVIFLSKISKMADFFEGFFRRQIQNLGQVQMKLG